MLSRHAEVLRAQSMMPASQCLAATRIGWTHISRQWSPWKQSLSKVGKSNKQIEPYLVVGSMVCSASSTSIRRLSLHWGFSFCFSFPLTLLCSFGQCSGVRSISSFAVLSTVYTLIFIWYIHYLSCWNNIIHVAWPFKATLTISTESM